MGVFSMTSPRARPTRLEARSGLARGAARFRPPHIPDELRNNQEMLQSIFPVVVFGAVALSVVMSVVFLVSRGSVYDQIGQGGISRDSEAAGWASAPAMGSPAGRAEQEREIRQMLGARSARMVRRGQPALDIDAEVTKLLQQQPAARDAGLVEEVRQLVTARNERRARKGLEPLDVAAEVERTLAELDP
ncbi:MAG TPA: hypothetical protein VFC30_01180 [Solirubrobacteraceae bacterium]|nr:hypothetical protein [Solirubrobacteraceae bacterium]